MISTPHAHKLLMTKIENVIFDFLGRIRLLKELETSPNQKMTNKKRSIGRNVSPIQVHAGDPGWNCEHLQAVLRPWTRGLLCPRVWWASPNLHSGPYHPYIQPKTDRDRVDRPPMGSSKGKNNVQIWNIFRKIQKKTWSKTGKLIFHWMLGPKLF